MTVGPRIFNAKMYSHGWEFAHRFSERIAVFLRKNERISDLLKKSSDSLIRSFLVSDLRDLLISLILVSDLSDSITSLIKKEGMSKSLVFFQNKKPI